MTPLAVVGAGSWGTVLACLLARQGHSVRLWARDPELAEQMRRERCNTRYLPDVTLPEGVEPAGDLAAAVTDCPLLLVVVPSVGVPWIAERLQPLVAPGGVLVSAAKGLDHDTGRRMSVVLREGVPQARAVAALSGPNLAHEIIAGEPAASVVACADETALRQAQDALNSTTYRVYTNPDVAGVELCGALKNPLAIAAGIIDGLGYGDNAKAALMTRGMHEIRRLGVALGADARTFAGLCGFGDLLATCHSPHSRNRTLGEQLGRGRRLADALAATTQVAEGVPTTRTAMRLAHEHGVEMPIVEQLHAVLFDDKPAREAGRDLMMRSTGHEFD